MNPDNKPHDWQGDIAQERDNRMDDGHMEGRGRHQSSEQYENEQCGPGVEQGQYIAAEDNNCHRGSRNFGNNVEPVYPSVKRGVPRSVIEAVAKQLEEETVSLFEDGIETEMLLADAAVEVLSDCDPNALYILEKYEGLQPKS